MSHAARNLHIAARDGLRASCIATPAAADPWPTALDFLASRLPTVTRGEWLARLQAGKVLAENGQSIAPHAPCPAGERLYYWREPRAEEPHIAAQEGILFQDDLIVVADKPHFLPVTPGGRYARQTLLTRLQQRLGLNTLTPVHRIDRETAGLVLFCVQPQHRGAYHALLRNQSLRKNYQAIAPLPPTPQTWPLTRRSRLIQTPGQFFTMCEAPDGPANSETHIQLQQTHGPWALYALQPVTGKRHQLRVHMAALGAPIMGDRLYPRVLESATQ
ncbi:MAG: pseudouridine synthase, partial [Burkholderiaceae bacterium]|nr:pseudouridine synthase [Burkholderiaceae bacterium]